LHEQEGVEAATGARDGGEVERYFHEGKIKEIADYCESDVVGTYQVWLRYELFRGTLSQNAFEASQRNLADFMNARSKINDASES
jgi:predicted PolB exonuclease-like 3'-5' exonuclease